jgi:hypothetical protein
MYVLRVYGKTYCLICSNLFCVLGVDTNFVFEFNGMRAELFRDVRMINRVVLNIFESFARGYDPAGPFSQQEQLRLANSSGEELARIASTYHLLPFDLSILHLEPEKIASGQEAYRLTTLGASSPSVLVDAARAVMSAASEVAKGSEPLCSLLFGTTRQESRALARLSAADIERIVRMRRIVMSSRWELSHGAQGALQCEDHESRTAACERKHLQSQAVRFPIRIASINEGTTPDLQAKCATWQRWGLPFSAISHLLELAGVGTRDARNAARRVLYRQECRHLPTIRRSRIKTDAIEVFNLALARCLGGESTHFDDAVIWSGLFTMNLLRLESHSPALSWLALFINHACRIAVSHSHSGECTVLSATGSDGGES